MAKARTWLWILVAFLGVCVLGLVLIAGLGLYFVSHHIAMQKTTSAEALRRFDTERARFKAERPIIEIDALERPLERRSLAEMPTAAVKPASLCVLAWDPDEGRLARIALPFWMLRIGRQKIDFLNDAHDFNFDRLNLDVRELERIGPALLLDYRTPSGERVLIWTQ